jgi:enoyl-CoA hydratase/carnithine racemase
LKPFVGPKRLIADMLEVEQPIIGAINGDAVGLGASVALNCDIVVANERARFADTHVKNLGVVAGDGGTVAWPLMMGIHKAKEYLLTGDLLLAADAAKFGFINYALPGDEVMPKAREIALRLANMPPWPVRWTKTVINKIVRERLNLTMDSALALEWLTFTSEDHREAVSAWNERRPGVYKGK